MLMFGEGAVYFSHLPMFMSPHDYQAIFAVTLTLQGSDPQAAYVQDRDQWPTHLHFRAGALRPARPS